MANRITVKLLDNLARILSINLGRPAYPYRDNAWQIGNIHIGNAGYGYSVDRVNSASGCISQLGGGMTARECYEWLQGALAVCREAGHDGPIADQWDGRGLRRSYAQNAVLVKFMGPTNFRGSRWQAKDKDKKGTVYGGFNDGPIAAAILWAEKVGLSRAVPRYAIQLSPDLYAVEF